MRIAKELGIMVVVTLAVWFVNLMVARHGSIGFLPLLPLTLCGIIWWGATSEKLPFQRLIGKYPIIGVPIAISVLATMLISTSNTAVIAHTDCAARQVFESDTEIDKFFE